MKRDAKSPQEGSRQGGKGREAYLSLTKEQVAEIVGEHRRSETDTGSPEVQVALLNARISYLTEHFRANRHDHHSRRGLYKLVGQQRGMLRYLYNSDVDRYRAIIAKLGLRDRLSSRAS